MPCDLIDAALEADKKMAEGMPTGGAAEVVDIIEDIREPLEEENETNEKVIITEEQKSQEEIDTMVLEGGIRYCSYENESEANSKGLCKDELEISDAIEHKPTETQENKSQNSVNQQVQPKPTPYPQPQNEPNSSVKPGIMPCQGKISSFYGWRTHPITKVRSFHNGIDIAAKSGVPVKALMDGVVTFAAYQGPNGNCVRINHGLINGKTVTSTSIHLNTIKVTKGQEVKQGHIIGTVGSTGKYPNGSPSSTGPHLHISVYENGQHVNPFKYIDPSRV